MGISLVVSSVSIAFLGAVASTIPRNGSLGIRTRQTKRSDAAWKRGHEAAAPRLRAYGYVDIALAIILIAYATTIGGFINCAAIANAAAKEKGDTV